MGRIRNDASTSAGGEAVALAPRFSEAVLRIARTRFYPNWWTHATDVRGPSNPPRYHVVVHTQRDAQLALASRPAFVDAEVEYTPTRKAG
jgi:hypothetical protein